MEDPHDPVENGRLKRRESIDDSRPAVVFFIAAMIIGACIAVLASPL